MARVRLKFRVTLGVAVAALSATVVGAQPPAAPASKSAAAPTKSAKPGELDPFARIAAQGKLRNDYWAILSGELTKLKARKAAEIWLPIVPTSHGPTPYTVRPGWDPDPSRKAITPPSEPDDVQTIRKETIKALESLAIRAKTQEAWSLAWDCWDAVMDRDRNHAEARRILGYLRRTDGWATPFVAKQREQGLIDHPHYGWVPQSWVEHLERGELPAPAPSQPRGTVASSNNGTGTKWLPAAEADSLRQFPNSPWEITTEHFVIRTNLPLREAIIINRALEGMYQVYSRVFADMFDEKLPVIDRMQNPKRAPEMTPSGARHEVYYFADKGGFVEHVRTRHGIDVTHSLGVYLTATDLKRKTNRGASFFYHDVQAEIPEQSTMFHEIAHQLQHELGARTRYRSSEPHYWIFEGAGAYFETLAPPRTRKQDGDTGSKNLVWTLGGGEAERILVARHRIIERKETMPLASLIPMDRNRFFQRNNVHLHYAEAMAFTQFLMHYDRGRYRAGLIAYLHAVHRGQLKRSGGQAVRDCEDYLGAKLTTTLQDQWLDYLANSIPKVEIRETSGN